MKTDYKQNFRVVGFIDIAIDDRSKNKYPDLECRDLDKIESVRCKICGASVLIAFYCHNCGTMHTDVIEDYINSENVNTSR